MSRLTAKLMVVMAAILATSMAFGAQRSYHKTLAAPAGGRLTFDTDIGSVSIVGGSAAQASVHVVLSGSERSVTGVKINAR